jgi:KDO2-lipid IV(A) lauroyltransferase
VQARSPAARPPLRKRIKRAVRFALLKAALLLVSRLPLAVAVKLGEALGTLAFHLARGERKKALDGLRRAFPLLPAAARLALAGRCFRHLGRSALELSCVDQIDPILEQYVTFPPEDVARITGPLAQGRGVVMVTGHLGNWELMGRRMGREFPMAFVGKETTDAGTTELVQRFRQGSNIQTLWRGRSGVARQMLKALRSQRALGLVIDQDTRVQSVFVPFFGDLCATPRSAADLALRTGAALVLVLTRREPDGRHVVWAESVEAVPGQDPEGDALRVTAELTARIEQAIRVAPEQWVWMHRRWKTRPQASGGGVD